jgi:hypothetical protein
MLEKLPEQPQEQLPAKNWANDLAVKLANSSPVSGEPKTNKIEQKRTGFADSTPKKKYERIPELEASNNVMAL